MWAFMCACDVCTHHVYVRMCVWGGKPCEGVSQGVMGGKLIDELQGGSFKGRGESGGGMRAPMPLEAAIGPPPPLYRAPHLYESPRAGPNMAQS